MLILNLGAPSPPEQYKELASCIEAMLTGQPLRPSLNSLYRVGDRPFECKEALEAHLAAREKDLSDLPERSCLFDLTNTY